MNYRKATLLASESATTAATKTIDINVSDVISRLQIKFNATNSTNTPTAHHVAQISKVEIVDGSDVLMSMSGRQIEALSFLDTKVPRFYPLDYRNGNEHPLLLDMYFGKKLWDTELGFDPKKFKNPQLKITHNKASGGSLPTSATLEVFADIFDEKSVSPVGWLMTKELKSFSTASGQANEYTELPNDFPIRRIMIEARKSQTWWDNIVSEVEVSEEEGKRKPWEFDGIDLLQLALQSYPPYVERIIGVTSGTDVKFFITPTEEANTIPTSIGSTSWVGQGEEYPVGGEVNLKTSSGDAFFRAIVAGQCPHGIVPLDCGDLMDMTDWYDVTKKAKIKLRLKAGGSTTVNVILQQLRKYA